MGTHDPTFRPRPDISISARHLDPCQYVILCGIYEISDPSRKARAEQLWNFPVQTLYGDPIRDKKVMSPDP